MLLRLVKSQSNVQNFGSKFSTTISHWPPINIGNFGKDWAFWTPLTEQCHLAKVDQGQSDGRSNWRDLLGPDSVLECRPRLESPEFSFPFAPWNKHRTFEEIKSFTSLFSLARRVLTSWENSCWFVVLKLWRVSKMFQDMIKAKVRPSIHKCLFFMLSCAPSPSFCFLEFGKNNNSSLKTMATMRLSGLTA